MSRHKVTLNEVRCDLPTCLSRFASRAGIIATLELAYHDGWYIGQQPNDPDYCPTHAPMEANATRRVNEEQ